MSMTIVDRRLNPKGKSLRNKQRFVHRAREALHESIRRDNGSDKKSDGNKDTIFVPQGKKMVRPKSSKKTAEPRFFHASGTGSVERIYPGNKEFGVGDYIPKPNGGRAGTRGKKASDSGDGEDDFQFILTREDFLDIFFEDLALPDLVKTGLKQIVKHKVERAGLSSSGTAVNLNLLRTMRNSYARRIALHRPRSEEVEELLARVFLIERKTDQTAKERRELSELLERIEHLRGRQRLIPYIDPTDLRYNNFERKPVPNIQAVMFCLMDVSGTMAQYEKELAKSFFMILHLFLERYYKKIDVVFVCHTHEGWEVEEEEFFYGRKTGGTIASTGLKEVHKIIKERFPADSWNIYVAQASDGDNSSGDSDTCIKLLNESILPLCQYYAYVEILDVREMEAFENEENGAELWCAYRGLRADWPNFAMKRIASHSHISPVFRELFQKEEAYG